MTDQLDGILLPVPQASMRDREESQMAATSRLAAMAARNILMPHNPRCGGTCRHRNCRRDHQLLARALAALGIPDSMPADADYASGIAWASVSRAEMSVLATRA